jgi:hypothetical protein
LSQLQRSHGNARVARAVATSGTVPSRSPGPSAPPTSTGSVVGPWGNDLTLAYQVAAAVEYAYLSLQDDVKDAGVGADVRKRAEDLIAEAKAWAEYLHTQGSATISATDARQITALLNDVGAVRRDVAWARGEPARAELRSAQREAAALEGHVREMQPRLDDAMRLAFKHDDEGTLRHLADVGGTSLDIAMGIHELSREMSESVAHLAGSELPELSRFTESLSKLNKGMAVIALAMAMTEEKATSELEEGARQVGAAAEAFAALSTLASLPAHIGLYANLYLVPLTKVCIVLIGQISEYMHEENKSWIELTGEPLRYGVEPGGEPMWRYMTAVMKATGDAPEMPDDVKEFFIERRKQFGAGAGAELPVTGWIWKDLDPKEGGAWVYRHRRQVWAMLYGSAHAPR